MTVYLVQYGGYDDGWVEAGFTKESDAVAFAAEMNKGGDELGNYGVEAFELDSRVGEKRVCEWYCLINPSEGDKPEDTSFMPLVHTRNVRADEASECESGTQDGYLSSQSTRSAEHAKELLIAEYEAWKAGAPA